MSEPLPALPSVKINGVAHEIAWGNLARVRYSGIPKEVREAGGSVPLATMLWASFAEKPHPYLTWEHLAEHIEGSQTTALWDALDKILPKAPTDEKKNTSDSGPSPA